MKLILALALTLGSTLALAHDRDLTIEYGYYNTEYLKTTCAETTGAAVEVPLFNEANLTFDKLIVGITLEETLFTANYNAADGVTCRYNAIFSMDKRKWSRTISLQKSQAFSIDGNSDASCDEMKTYLDGKLTFTPYKIDYDFVGIALKNVDEASTCADGSVMPVYKRIRRR